jgi:hypothetical protein
MPICTATTEISFSVTIRDSNGSLLVASALGSKTLEADAGFACANAGSTLSESITGATKDALERLAEKISNSPRLHKIAGGS